MYSNSSGRCLGDVEETILTIGIYETCEWWKNKIELVYLQCMSIWKSKTKLGFLTYDILSLWVKYTQQQINDQVESVKRD